MAILDRLVQSLLPLGLLLALIATSLWLKNVVDHPEQGPLSKLRHDPDLVATHFIAHRLSPQGTLAQTLEAQAMRHYPDDDSSLYEKAILRAFEPGKPVTQIVADEAERLQGNETIFFTGHVEVTRAPEPHDPEAWLLKSDTLEVYPNQKQGRSKTPVTVLHGKDHLEALKMAFDYNLYTVEFERARTYFAPRPR